MHYKFTNREAVIGTVGLVIGVLLGGSLMWVSAQNDTPVSVSPPAVTVSTPSITEQSARGARNYARSLACRALPLDTAKSVMGDQTLAVLDTDNISSVISVCRYSAPDKKTLVSLQVYRETTAVFKTAYQAIANDYEQNKNEPYYRKASVTYWPTGPNHAMPSATYAFTVHTMRYGDDLIYVNDDYYTVRISMRPAPHDKMFTLAETALMNLKPNEK